MNKKTWEQDHTVCEQQDHFPQISVLTSLSRFRRKDDVLFALVSGICADESCKPVREQSDQDMTLGHWEQSDQTKMWPWESFVTSQSSNPSKDAWWKCLEARLPSTICRPGLYSAIMVSSDYLVCHHRLDKLKPPLNAVNKRKHGANIFFTLPKEKKSCKHVEQSYCRLASCTPPRLVLRCQTYCSR